MCPPEKASVRKWSAAAFMPHARSALPLRAAMIALACRDRQVSMFDWPGLVLLKWFSFSFARVRYRPPLAASNCSVSAYLPDGRACTRRTRS